jgi:hypothetical protein
MNRVEQKLPQAQDLSMKSPDAVSSLQLFPWPTMLAVVKNSINFADFDTFYSGLADRLPQNSPETRRRIANLIVRRYYPERSLNSLPSLVWRAYQREDILIDVMRVATLETEPVVARFVLEHIVALAPGDPFDVGLARDFITKVYGGFKQDSYSRLLITVQALGLIKHQGTQWFVQAVPRPDNALLILLHARLAPTPRIVRVSDILSGTFWRYLGLREPGQVRAILQDAQAANLIARYVIVDELEQVTTQYSFEEYLAKALRL